MPPLLFKYEKWSFPDSKGRRKLLSSEMRSPSDDRALKKKGGTPAKLARQRVVARCVKELFKELCAIVLEQD